MDPLSAALGTPRNNLPALGALGGRADLDPAMMAFRMKEMQMQQELDLLYLEIVNVPDPVLLDAVRDPPDEETRVLHRLMLERNRHVNLNVFWVIRLVKAIPLLLLIHATIETIIEEVEGISVIAMDQVEGTIGAVPRTRAKASVAKTKANPQCHREILKSQLKIFLWICSGPSYAISEKAFWRRKIKTASRFLGLIFRAILVTVFWSL
ncbi:unnamed protein product [Amoebophrya sp. A25]|nr:unnamed protein product [Amoebophrya sp. A25]|eukprot:GSA25T00020996001.1